MSWYREPQECRSFSIAEVQSLLPRPLDQWATPNATEIILSTDFFCLFCFDR